MGDLLARLDYIKKGVDALNELLKERSEREVLEDFILLNSVLHILQTSIQALVDIGARVLSEMGRKPPSIYREVAVELKNINVLSSDESNLMIKIIGFRNIVVHEYLGINEKLLGEILGEKRYEDILKLAMKIVEKASAMGIDP